MTRTQANQIAEKYRALGYDVRAQEGVMGPEIECAASDGDERPYYAFNERDLQVLVQWGRVRRIQP